MGGLNVDVGDAVDPQAAIGSLRYDSKILVEGDDVQDLEGSPGCVISLEGGAGRIEPINDPLGAISRKDLVSIDGESAKGAGLDGGRLGGQVGAVMDVVAGGDEVEFAANVE